MIAKKHLLRALSIPILVAVALTANISNAQISYDFGEIRYLSSDRDNGDSDGIEVAGSYQFDEDWLVLGSYASENGDIDADVFEFGVGYLLPDFEGVNMMVSLSVLDSELSDQGDDNGFRLALQGRKMLTDELEGRATLNFVDTFDRDLFFEIGADYFFNPRFSAGAELQLGSDTDQFSIGARWYFKN